MKRHLVVCGLGCASVVGLLLGSSVLGNSFFMPDATGQILLLAPCDAQPVAEEVTGLLASTKKVLFKLTAADSGAIFASAASVTSDADETVFVLSLKVEQAGKVISAGTADSPPLKKGMTAPIATICGVSPSKGKYTVTADVRVNNSTKALDSKSCPYTAP
jgi:hypothetical protein